MHLLRYHANLRTQDGPLRCTLPDIAMHWVRDYIGDNLAADLRLADIAVQTELSLFHLMRLFKCMTGNTLHQHLIQPREERGPNDWY